MSNMLRVIGSISDYTIQSKAIVALASRLPEALVEDALRIATQIPCFDKRHGFQGPSTARADALAGLAPRVPAWLFGKAIVAAIEIPTDRPRARALAALMPTIPDEYILPTVSAVLEFSEEVRPMVVIPLMRRIVDPIHGDTVVSKASVPARLRDAPVAMPTPKQYRAAMYSEIAKKLPGVGDDMEGSYHRIRVNAGESKNLEVRSEVILLYNHPTVLEEFQSLLECYLETEGNVEKNTNQKLQLWLSALAAENVPESERATLIAKFQIEIARATRPKWEGRLERGGKLATLSAPSFLKNVHAEDIAPDGTVRTEVIRAIDPKLMQAVVLYISQRRARDQNLGDAEGLNFILSKPSRARIKPKRSRPSAPKTK
jgi:hypothetical protein